MKARATDSGRKLTHARQEKKTKKMAQRLYKNEKMKPWILVSRNGRKRIYEKRKGRKRFYEKRRRECTRSLQEKSWK